MKNPKVAFVLVAAMVLYGCGRSEPRSQAYFSAHLDEARQVVDGCREGSIRGDECANADYAVQLAEAEARGAHFFKRDRQPAK